MDVWSLACDWPMRSPPERAARSGSTRKRLESGSAEPAGYVGVGLPWIGHRFGTRPLGARRGNVDGSRKFTYCYPQHDTRMRRVGPSIA